MKTPHLIAFGVIFACMIVMLFSFSGAINQHVTVAQAASHPNETLQVPGNIVKETVFYDRMTGQLKFDIVGVDPKSRQPDPSQRMSVVYHQPKPENFDTATSVEAIGQYKNGLFEAKTLLVKCPSKYNDSKPGQVAKTL